MRFFCLLAFVAVALCQDSPPIRGTATVTIDLRGLSPDVSVSFSTDLANVYRGQGGGIRTYTVPTTNSIQNVQVVITEGGVATFSASSPLTNGGTWTVNGHLAQLRVHLENYAADVPSGNYFNVKLRVTIAGQEQVFREYNDFASPSSSSVVPLSELGPIPSSTFYTVTVLAVTQPVTVFAGEWYGAVQAVWVVGHNGNGQIVDSNCRDLVCDSGRLVARATYQLACDGSFDYQLPASTRVTLWSNPSPTVSDVQIVRRSFNVPSSTFSRHVLAVDNYQFIVENGNVKKVAALNCAIGECEAAPLVSILSVFSSTLRGTVQVSVEGNLFSTPYNIVRDETRICVLNLPLTEVTASFTTGGVVVQRNIDCGDVNQRCNTYVYGTLTPNYSCLPTSGLSVAVVVAAADGTPVYQRFGVAASSIVVPALAGLKLKIYDGASAWAPSGFFPPAVNAFEYVEQSVTDCSAFQDVNTNHQDGNRPGACTVTERADRMLSIFDLAFLPQWEPGFLGSGQLPPNGPNTSVTVTLQLPGAQVFRVVTNQGGAPRMYCVLPNLIEAKITENTACYTSEAQDCRPINPAGLADCSVCDFLSVLQYDLKGLPREVNSQIYVGPVEGARTTLINQDFSVFGSGACNRLVNGSSIGFYNLSPRSEEIEIWGQGCSGAPATFPANNGPAGGQATGNTLKVGRIENSKKSVVAPHLDRTCVTFNTPQFSEAINVGFYAWQHGNAAFQNQLAYVTAVGSLSGSSLRAWINFNRGQWNWNSIRLLDTLPEEQVTVCWVQSGQFGLNIDNVVVDTDVYPLTLIRSMAWQGNFFNQIPVLRAGAGLGCPYGVYQRYCIRVIDGSAWKQECTVCNDRTCMPMNPFACEMCLNLASPNDTPGLENQIRLSISFGNGNVRSVDGQGGTNGCARNKRADNELRTTFARLEQRITEARGLTSKVLQSMELDEIEKQRREIMEEVKQEYIKMHGRAGPYPNPGQVQSRYPVLCLKYRVCVSESCQGPLCFDVDCTRFGSCSYENIIADASIDFSQCPSLPNVTLTLYNSEASFTPNGTLVSGCQLRGPESPMLLDQATCTWSAPKFIGPSYSDAGGLFRFPVLRLPVRVRVDENTKAYTGTPFPEIFQHPWKSAVLDCTDSASCNLPVGRLAAKWTVSSNRGLPDNNLFQIKFGDNSQNVIREISGDFLSAPAPNEFCVISDARPYYVAQWGSWSSRGPFLPFDNCATTGPNIQPCLSSVTVPPISK